MYYTNMRIRT